MSDLRALCNNLPLNPRPPFSNLVGWWQHRPPPADSTIDFWQSYLAGAKQLGWPSKAGLGPDEALSTTAFRAIEWRGDLKTLSKKHGITPAIASRVAIHVALAHRARQDEVSVGVVRSGRDIDLAEADEIIGPCVSVLPSRLEIKPQSNLLELMKAEGLADRRARRHQEVTLPQLAKWCDLPGRDGLFDILVTFQSLALHDDEDDERKPLWPLRQPPARIFMPTGYSLSFEITPNREHADELELAVFYDPRVVTAEEVDEVVGWVGTVLEWMTVAPCTEVGKLDLGEPGQAGVARRPVRVDEDGEGSDVSQAELERLIEAVREAWAATLKLDGEDVGVDDTFASLGGDSVSSLLTVSQNARQGSHSLFVHSSLFRSAQCACRSPSAGTACPSRSTRLPA